MDRRQFFGSIAAAAAGALFPRLLPRRRVYEAPRLVSLGVLPPAVLARIQEATLRNVYRDALQPQLLFRATR